MSTLDPLLLQAFARPVTASGYVEDLTRRVRNRFEARFVGTINPASPAGAEELQLHETLTMSDGTEQIKQWSISAVSDDRMVARCDGLLSLATIVRHGERGLRWTYDIGVPINGRSIRAAYDDIMVFGDNGVITSTATIKKFGLTFARTVTVYMPESTDIARQQAA